MALSFQKYLNHHRDNTRIETAASLIIETGFPIDQFHDWYCDKGVHLPTEDGQVILENFWRDTAKGALGGAAIGTAAGGGPGALIGGAAGAFMGGSKHLARGFQKWWNPNAYRINAFMRNRDEVVQMLHQMKLLADEMKNDTSFAKGGGKSLHNPAFDNLLNKTISFLSVIEKPQLVGANPPSSTPSTTPTPPPTPGTGGGTPTGPKDEAELEASPEFKTTLGEVMKFANTFHPLDATAFTNTMKAEVWKLLSTGKVKWPDVMDQYKQEIIFDDTDTGYQEVLKKIQSDPKYTAVIGNPPKTAKWFYLLARITEAGKGMSPSALAQTAIKILDSKMAPKPTP